MNIFISRPNWFEEKYKVGFDKFNSFLLNNNIIPRTLGISDYPNQSPLDEVIRIMKECKGIIVLGYPQINIKEGSIKGDKINSTLNLATEWNHIEAALAYSLNLPMLIFHDKNVGRGVFDRGTLNSFIHEVDLSNDSWILEPNIIGAFNTWKTKSQNFSISGSIKNVNEFEEFKGMFFKRKKTGDFDDTVYCPDCKSPMMALEKILPYMCSKCGATSGFKSGEITSILKELNNE